MNVLHITGYITGGAGIAVKRLHEALLERNINSKILCMFALDENVSKEVYALNQPKTLSYKILLNLKIDKNSLLLGNLKGHFEAFTFPYSIYRLHEHPLVKQADIIHLHWISDFVDIPSFFTRVNKPMVWTAHDLNPIMGGFHYQQDAERNPNFARLEAKLKSEKQYYTKRAGLQFIGSSRHTVEKIRASIDGVKCTEIPCVLDTESFQPVDKKSAKAALGIPQETLVFGTGADDLENYRKGYWLLLQAISVLKDDDKRRIKLLSFGAAKENRDFKPAEFPELIRFEPIHNKRLHSLIYSAMDYFIIPSVEETFGLTGTEALLCNTPLISSDTGGMSDYVTEGVNGYLFEPGNKDQLLNVITNVIQQRKNGDYSSVSCRQSILNWYSQKDPVNHHIKLYQEMMH